MTAYGAVLTDIYAHDATGRYIQGLFEEPATEGIDASREQRAATGCGRFSASKGRNRCDGMSQPNAISRYQTNYLGALSEASVGSIALQGGPMSAAEVAELERNPYFEAVVKLRQIDDRARDPSVTTSPFARLDFLFGD